MLPQEQMGYMKIDDLHFYIARLEDERRMLLNRNFDVTNIEIDIAYAQREVNYREVVCAAHQEYLKNNPEETENW